ncbi:MAG: hypothetical protein IT292_08730 [Deltaproteobacteria bacterium]|nr:hypothetical protein [Deltaproteobacteria bacterium]
MRPSPFVRKSQARRHRFPDPLPCPSDAPPSQPQGHRTNGNYTLSIQPGYATDPKTKQRYCVGYPFGSIPRLLMFWITTEALRTGSKRLTLGNSLAEFMKALGLNHRNGGMGSERSDRRRLHDQMERLFRATISFECDSLEVRRWKDMQVAPKGELSWDLKRPNQSVLWDSWVELGEKFYEAIIASPVPVDMRALRELKNSPLALDLLQNFHPEPAKEIPAHFLASNPSSTWNRLQRPQGLPPLRQESFEKSDGCLPWPEARRI